MGERRYVYEDWDRAEVLPFVPEGISSLLDIGCAFGGFGAALKTARPDLEVFGIEPEACSAEIAATLSDGVMTGWFPEAMPSDKFDCIVFNDVLEHMSDPWSALEIAGGVVNDCGRVVASIPNVRHYTVLVPLLVKGRWTYHDVGILDRTHLRFFTRSTVRELFETTGWAVESITPTRLDEASTGEIARVLSLLGKRGIDFRARNFVVVARVAGRARRGMKRVRRFWTTRTASAAMSDSSPSSLQEADGLIERGRSSSAFGLSVVIATFNGAAVINEQLTALVDEEVVGGFEVVVADNGSVDATTSIVQSFSDRVSLRLVDASTRRGQAWARNVGAQASRASVIVFLDQDDRISPGYLGAMQRALELHEFVAARIETGTLNQGWRVREIARGARPAKRSVPLGIRMHSRRPQGSLRGCRRVRRVGRARR